MRENWRQADGQSYNKSCFNLFQFYVIHFGPNYRPFAGTNSENYFLANIWNSFELGIILGAFNLVFSVSQTTSQQILFSHRQLIHVV